MIPTKHRAYTTVVEEETIPSKDYGMNLDTERINGYVTDVEDVKQACYKILNTERYQYIMYSWNYGIQLMDLYGKDYDYVVVELKRRITESLEWDDRVESVDNFTFSQNGDSVLATFTVHTIYGQFDGEESVNV